MSLGKNLPTVLLITFVSRTSLPFRATYYMPLMSAIVMADLNKTGECAMAKNPVVIIFLKTTEKEMEGRGRKETS